MEQPQQQIQGYRPVLAEQAAEMMSVDQCQSIGDLDDSQLVGAPDVKGGGGEAEVKEAKSSDNSLGKRRRGRPPGPHARVKTTPLMKKNEEEEDVCFICFDGGSLVLCDRRGCPKAYHPVCIKRDEAFFKSKAKWNCGWHICSSCQKASHYMCYTCTYSLCKACIKDADYQSVRGNKGFCGTCMRTIMLIENVPGNKEAAQVDFDDTSSWEYLFKVYWILLKGQLSLTVNDLIKAKNPWRGAAVMASTGGAVGGLYVGNKTNDSGSVKSCADLEATNTIGSNKKPKLGDGGMSFLQGSNWASKELLEFVAHMKNGDVSVLSQFEAQALLLEYIKKNNLRDPHRKCQIICDPRLRNLFGKECVGHFEMLKLLEYHFLTKEISMTENVIGPGVANIVAGEMEIDVNYDDQIMMGAGSDKRRKARKRVEDRVHPNPDAYAAIDAHNINMIYLRHNLIENLIDDADKFHERVVGSVVRIRISNSDQKQDIYRLVQVIGTNKAAEGYKIGTRTTNMNIEILNLDKKEVVPIDQISDQEFSQDECNRLRQSIECGLIKRFTVGEIRDKAMALRAIRVKDELAAEALRVSHLRDLASEKGRRKELRNLVEKLQLLNSPEERQRRLREIPEVHSDPKMDPSYVPEDNVGEIDEQQDNTVQPSRSVSGRKGRYSFSPQREGDISKNIGNRAQKTQGQKALERNGWNSTTNQGNLTGLVQCGSNYELVVQSNILSDVASESSSVLYSIDNFEMEKIWHYQDPTGKIQGPFAMVQLCKWGTTGVFPPDHRIWRTNENQEDSILLTDALNGQYCKETFLPHENNASSQGSTVAVDERNSGCDGGWNKSMNATPIDGKRVEVSWNTKHNGQMNSGNAEVERRSAPADVIDSGEKQTGIFLQGCDPVILENSLPSQPQECCSLTSPVLHVKPYEVLSHQEGEGTAENNSHQNNGSVDWRQTTQDQKIKEHSNENRSDSEGQSVQSSGQSCRHPRASSPSNGCDSTSNFAAKSLETSEQDKRVLDYPDFPGPTPKSSNGDLQGLASENNHSVSLNLPVQDGGHSWSDSNLVGSGEQLQKVADDWGGYSPTPAKPYIDEWDSSLVSASSPKPREMTSDYVPTQVSVSGQLTEPIPSHPTSDVSGWQAILAATGDFCTLTAYESVSDLLAEVEAMETLCGLATTTSIMNCGGEFTEGSKNDSVGSVEGFSTATEPGKGDALSSTCDIQLPSDAMVTDEPLGICQASVQDLQQKSGVHPSTSPDMQGDGKPSDNSANKLEANVSVDELEAGEIPIIASSKVCWDMPSTDEPRKARLESAETSLAAVQGNVNVSWRGLGRGTCDLPDLPHRSLVHSSPSVELEVDRKPSGSSANQLEANVSVNQPKANVSGDQLEPGEIQVTAPFKDTRDMSGTDSPQKPSLDSTETSYKAVQGNANAGWGGDRGSASISWGRSDPGSANVGWRGGQGIIQATAAGGMWEGQARYGGDRPIAPRGRGCPNRDLGSGRGRFVGNRQGLYGNGNGGGSSRPPLRGQRVCKYYESGNCKKGALCSYLHP